ncbi:TIGR00730 family Rossman fold protein [Fictibacillus enclensis]|uniref:LOG family protein n=1 Tax=Fictibacillus enclensis TaxID=1017270 RepID=UPI0024BFEBBE|nr:TIGR00730 family Rossman fold protein [Fictibacillus enclensis]MDM5197330.1 TIGR00730 family Rossman fold protein [Fictibacillus enclensis]MDM5336477.1 TIGR00730 family Rossman fold protein [Fictibacillus enclensis]WHY72940.1 TIGR00730 family Rossman fold protein [Fictibacillus enclensis]
MNHIAVFCGSRSGKSEVYVKEAARLGKELAERGIGLVYGGSSAGVMGAVADAVMENGGQVTGIMPEFLEKREIAHKNLTQLVVVDSMHERKAKMAELADGFMVLPGGAGTLEEFFEIFTWAQLGLHQKPVGLLNTNGYYDPLLSLFNHMTSENFMEEKHHKMVLSSAEPKDLLDQFSSYSPPSIKSYLTENRT